MLRRIAVSSFLLLVMSSVALSCVPLAAQINDSLDTPPLQIKKPAKAVLLSIAKAGNRLVAVGERGIIITSEDGGKVWTQAAVPSSDTLTVVRFISANVGWAAGHSGLVLHTEDGGKTWTRQLDGTRAAKLALDVVRARFEGKSASATLDLQNAERMVQEGPDKPFLDLYFENAQRGIVVGAYGMVVTTEDGGKTWTSWMDRLENPEGYHLYAVAKAGDNIYLAGEQGMFFHSKDGGKHFKRITTPYAGTYFRLVVTPIGEVILAGMKGTIMRFNGTTFTKVQSPSSANLSATTWLSDGSLFFLNQAGQILISRDQGKTVEAAALPPLPPSAAMIEAANGLIMTVGVTGVIPVPLAATAVATSPGGAQ